MVTEKELEDVWLQKIPLMFCLVQLLVLLDCSWKLVVAVGFCCKFCEDDELHYYLFLNLLKVGRVFVITVV